MELLKVLSPGDCYAGVGSRETPPEVLEIMRKAAGRLSARGLILRSGGARGADKAFESGVPADGAKEIYLPWPRYELHSSLLYQPPAQAFEVAAAYHPGWDRLSEGGRKLMARNAQQVLGAALDRPARFVLCWTKDGGPSGGTGQAIRIAAGHGIPVFNLMNMMGGRRHGP